MQPMLAAPAPPIPHLRMEVNAMPEGMRRDVGLQSTPVWRAREARAAQDGSVSNWPMLSTVQPVTDRSGCGPTAAQAPPERVFAQVSRP